MGGEGEEAAQARAELPAPNTAAPSQESWYSRFFSSVLTKGQTCLKDPAGNPLSGVAGWRCAAHQRRYQRSRLLEPSGSHRNKRDELSL